MGLLSLTVLMLLTDFEPYVRSRTTTNPAAHCLWWPNKIISYSQSGTGNPGTGQKSLEAVTTAFATWQVAMQECGSAALVEGPRAKTRRIGVEPGLANVNLVLFRVESCSQKALPQSPCWQDGTCGNLFDCWDHAAGLLGVTTVTYDKTTGQMIDADIELNSSVNVFTVVSSPMCNINPTQDCVAIDIQNTTTHEIGHLMGLEHTELSQSTMNANASMGDLNKRSIDTGTKAFVCEVYTKGLGAKDCVIDPASTTIGSAAATANGCSATRGNAMPWLLSAIALVALFLRRHKGAYRALVVMLCAGSAEATTMFPLSIEELARSSHAVVHARVRRIHTRWTADRARIETETELEVKYVWKGTPGKIILVTQPGGEVGPIGQRVAGTASFEPDEEVVLFLEERGLRFTVTGFMQGKFHVDRQGSALNASQDTGDVAFLNLNTGQQIARRPLALPLEILRRRVMGTVTSTQPPALGPTLYTP